MIMSLFTPFKLFGAVSKFAEKALEDRKITITQTVALAEEFAQILDVPLEIDIAPERFNEKEPAPDSGQSVEVKPHKTHA